MVNGSTKRETALRQVRSQNDDIAVVPTDSTPVGSEPQIPLHIFEDAPDFVATKAVVATVSASASSRRIVFRNPIRCSKPDRSVAILKNSGHKPEINVQNLPRAIEQGEPVAR